MKNITITLNEETARWVRIEAALRETSVSRLVGEILDERRQRDLAYENAAARFLKRKPSRLKSEAQTYPKRDELHDRTVLR
jgi:hypothetical protein